MTFWNRILEFAERHLIPFIERHLPRILPYIRQIFVDLTKATLATKRAVKWAWQQVKPFLVQVLTEYRYTSGNIWVRSITAWVIQRLDSPSHMMRLHEEEEVPMSEVPQEVLDNYRKGQHSTPINFLEARDHEIMDMHMARS